MPKKILLGLLGLILLLAIGGYAYYRLALYQAPLITAEDRAEIDLIPLPAKLELHEGRFAIAPNFWVQLKGHEDERLKRAVSRFYRRLFALTLLELDHSDNKEGPAALQIHCREGTSQAVQQLREDESYSLHIDSDGISLKANGPYGVLRGLETLLQLVEVKENESYFPALEIEDEPRFPWRGLMIDVSRHWIPKAVILRNLNAMAAVKMNVLHLHLSDDQAFRVESKAFPLLHELGSDGNYYTQADIGEMVAFAADRGIRVVPEFDMPGHTQSWLVGYPQYASTEGPFQLAGEALFTVPMDPTHPALYPFLDTLIGEMATLFPDPYFHTGGDEVNPHHWEHNPRIRQFMTHNDLANGQDLQAYFNQQIHPIVRKHGKIMLGWEEILHPELSKEVVVQSWRNQKSLFEAVQAGGTGILSAGYYLDYKLPAAEHYAVDPLVLPGAVDIEPDTGFWKAYQIQMEAPGGSQLDLELVLFDRDPQNVFGFFGMMGQRTAFHNARLSEEGTLIASFNPGIGDLTYEARLQGDSIQGQMKLGFMALDSRGFQIGGTDKPGTSLPRIEVIRPLTEAEKKRILGGEAALWTELVSATNIDSRLWPRTMAMAEKWWSPAELTQDSEDMYRRLWISSSDFNEMGMKHLSYYPDLLYEMVGEKGYPILKQLALVLEEVKYYNRHSAYLSEGFVYWPDLALDGIADAVLPESPRAWRFNRWVDEYFDHLDTNTGHEIRGQVALWAGNHRLLDIYIQRNEKLESIREISERFSRVAGVIVQAMDGESINQEEALADLVFLENGQNGVMVAVVPGLRRLLMHSIAD